MISSPSRRNAPPSPIRRNAPPQFGQAHGAGWIMSSRGKCSGNGRRTGFRPSFMLSIAAATTGEAVAIRSARSIFETHHRETLKRQAETAIENRLTARP